MKYVAIFFVALFAVAITDKSEKKRCELDGEVLLDGTPVDCSTLYNSKTDNSTGMVYCCKDDDRTPAFKTKQIDDGTEMFVCACKKD
ncbi:hypothetical protein PoB_000093200 [Plakobranchus ocellatus]|uniref:Plethodontid modulating factor n=1 Tax=Plakobranchus ocellatus TaxID=259542 RepID=A0AAV3XWB2_9GAST|nr:hypothetical protein PoB_000093200 [Plakobranchus ocellatus]